MYPINCSYLLLFRLLYSIFPFFTGAAVNFKNVYGDSPLLWAAFHGDSKTVQLLLQKGEFSWNLYDYLFIVSMTAS